MMLVSVLADHAALRLTERTHIHASAGRLWNACEEANARHGFVRTLCGVDALFRHDRTGVDCDACLVIDEANRALAIARHPSRSTASPSDGGGS